MTIIEGASGAVPRDRDAAVSGLFTTHYARLVGIARLLVDDRSTAEDVVQDAFVALYKRWAWLRDEATAPGYLEACVVNGARSSLRRRRTVRHARLQPPGELPSAETTAVEAEGDRELRLALATLPLRQRQVLVLRYYLEQSEAQIAATLSISRGSVKTHASRALAALGNQLEQSS